MVLKKVICRNNRGYLMQNLFGAVMPPYAKTDDFEGGTGDPNLPQECVVCLTAPREVAVLHCKHVCLCKPCASVTSSTWSYQCPICRGRVAAFVGIECIDIPMQ